MLKENDVTRDVYDLIIDIQESSQGKMKTCWNILTFSQILVRVYMTYIEYVWKILLPIYTMTLISEHLFYIHQPIFFYTKKLK